MINIIKNISLKTLDVLFFNNIIFILNNLFYISQIGYLDTHTRLINREGGSTKSDPSISAPGALKPKHAVSALTAVAPTACAAGYLVPLIFFSYSCINNNV
jgi:hypothetical protein